MASIRSGLRDGDSGFQRRDVQIRLEDQRFGKPRPYASRDVMHSGFVEVGRLRVHHTHGGRGSPVVFIHGLGSASYIEWRYNLESVAARHHVYAPDLPGFGRSEKPRA